MASQRKLTSLPKVKVAAEAELMTVLTNIEEDARLDKADIKIDSDGEFEPKYKLYDIFLGK